MNIARIIVRAAVVIALSLSTGSASSIFTNNSFENMTGSLGGPTSLGVTIKSTNSTTMGGWNVSVGSSVIGLAGSSVTIGNSSTIGCPTPNDGTNAVRMNLAAGIGTSISLSQSSTTAFVPNSAYKLLFDIDPGLNLTLFGGTTLSLEAGTGVVASISGSTLLGQLSAGNSFQTVEVDFTTGSTAPTGNVGILFQQNSVVGLGGNVYVDNAQLTYTPVPEPNMLFVMLGGMGLLAVINRTRNKLA